MSLALASVIARIPAPRWHRSAGFEGRFDYAAISERYPMSRLGFATKPSLGKS